VVFNENNSPQDYAIIYQVISFIKNHNIVQHPHPSENLDGKGW